VQFYADFSKNSNFNSNSYLLDTGCLLC